MKPSIDISYGVYAKADRALIPYIAACTHYRRKVVYEAQWGTKVEMKDAWGIDRRNGVFLAGLLPRITQFLQGKGIDFDVTGDWPAPLLPQRPPQLKDMELRPYQLGMIEQINQYQRGVIRAPTGSGKTITALGLLSQWPSEARVCILCHRRIILSQFFKRIAQQLGPYSMQAVHGDMEKPVSKEVRILVAMVQTMAKQPRDELRNRFDILLVDEVHHATEDKNQMSTLIRDITAPIKVGFTGTLPDENDVKKVLTLEGLMGPVIGDLSIKEGQKMGIIAKPYVTLVGVPYLPEIAEKTDYAEIYRAGIVENRARNAIITKLVKARTMAGLSSLTIIKEIAHGEALAALAERFKVPSIFVHGGTPDEQRNAARDALEAKTHLNVIVTDVWREGIDIPTLDCVIMAAGGKSKIYTLQAVGRGMRVAEGKEWVEVVDFLDPYKHLGRHVVLRLNMYKEHGWL